jgi:regulatory protein
MMGSYPVNSYAANRDSTESEPGADDEFDAPADAEAVARHICLQLLDIRARSRAELATVLRRRRVPVAAADLVLDRFIELELIDDAALAQSFALARHTERGHAGAAIKVQLRRRGIADDVISDAIAQIDPASEAAAARSLARTRLARMSDLDVATATRRLLGLLGRRGYSSAMAREAIRAVLTECRDGARLEVFDTGEQSD